MIFDMMKSVILVPRFNVMKLTPAICFSFEKKCETTIIRMHAHMLMIYMLQRNSHAGAKLKKMSLVYAQYKQAEAASS
jgi:hypothetical protein